MPPLDIMKKDANEAYSRFIGLITKNPVGTVEEIMEWKNEGRR